MSTSASFRPNTYCSILRTDEGETDEFGDPVDNETVAASGIPISIIHKEVSQFLPVEHRKTVYNDYVARLRADIEVKSTDRIKDERTGNIFMVEGVFYTNSPLWASATRLELRKLD